MNDPIIRLSRVPDNNSGGTGDGPVRRHEFERLARTVAYIGQRLGVSMPQPTPAAAAERLAERLAAQYRAMHGRAHPHAHRLAAYMRPVLANPEATRERAARLLTMPADTPPPPDEYDAWAAAKERRGETVALTYAEWAETQR